MERNTENLAKEVVLSPKQGLFESMRAASLVRNFVIMFATLALNACSKSPDTGPVGIAVSPEMSEEYGKLPNWASYNYYDEIGPDGKHTKSLDICFCDPTEEAIEAVIKLNVWLSEDDAEKVYFGDAKIELDGKFSVSGLPKDVKKVQVALIDGSEDNLNPVAPKESKWNTFLRTDPVPFN